MIELKKFEQTILLLFVMSNAMASITAFGAYRLCTDVFGLDNQVSIILAATAWLFIVVVFGIRHTKAALRPTASLYEALAHLSEEPSDKAPPNPEDHGISSGIVAQVLNDIYSLSSGQHDAQTKLATSKEFAESILKLQSNPLLVLDRNKQITFANKPAMETMPKSITDPLGMTLEEAYSLEFSSGISFEDWFNETLADKIQDRHVWERVRVAKTDDTIRYFDMVADYNKNESHGLETIVIMVDKTASYREDDEEMSFVSLAVHELRSPISLLRGYIEVFEDELASKLDTDQKLFMNKMSASAGQLSTFVNNILNVARIENDQLKVHLAEDTIYDALNSSKEDFMLRAEVRNRKLSYKLADGIPSVGLDRVGIYEVMSNLVDNAIKYSKDGGEIVINADSSETGGVTVSITDSGIGIPESSMENLFERFYRSHHSRDKVSGTGLGLFLSKTIIEAHGGKVWVKSIEGEGSTFGFDLPTYESIKQEADDEQPADGSEIVRSAHGWIKNHGKVRK